MLYAPWLAFTPPPCLTLAYTELEVTQEVGPLSCVSGFLTIVLCSDEIFAMKRRGGDSPSTFAEEQAKCAAEQIDVLTNLGESLLDSLQGVKLFGFYARTAS